MFTGVLCFFFGCTQITALNIGRIYYQKKEEKEMVFVAIWITLAIGGILYEM